MRKHAPLNVRERGFALRFLNNGGNASDAYRAVSPRVTTETAKVEGHRCLTRPHVKAFIDRARAQQFAALKMTAAEALGRVIADARSDIRELFDQDGQLLPPCRWPDAICNSIESFELTRGGYRIRLVTQTAGEARYPRTDRPVEVAARRGGERVSQGLAWGLGTARRSGRHTALTPRRQTATRSPPAPRRREHARAEYSGSNAPLIGAHSAA